MTDIVCEYCGKPINPIAISTMPFRNKTKYHEGCRKKASYQRKKAREEIREKIGL